MDSQLRDSLAGARSACLSVYFTLVRQATAAFRRNPNDGRPYQALRSLRKVTFPLRTTKRDRDLLPAIRHEDGCRCPDCIACRCGSDGEFGALVDGCPIHGATASEA